MAFGTVNNNKGVTLMELIVVVAIVAVIVGYGYPNYNRVKQEVRRQDAHAALVALEAVIERHLAENNKATFDSTDLALSQFANYATGGTPTYTKDGYYRLIITPDSTGYIIDATAVATSGALTSCSTNQNYKQCADKKCRVITIDHGAKVSKDDLGASASATTTTCW